MTAERVARDSGGDSVRPCCCRCLSSVHVAAVATLVHPRAYVALMQRMQAEMQSVEGEGRRMKADDGLINSDGRCGDVDGCVGVDGTMEHAGCSKQMDNDELTSL